MRKKRFIYTLAAVLLMCSAAGVGAGCGKSSPALLDSFGIHLDTLMTSKDKLSKMDGAAADLCVIENEDEFSENDIEAPAGALILQIRKHCTAKMQMMSAKLQVSQKL